MASNSNFIFFVILLENQKVIHSFANRAQPSSHKLSGDVTGSGAACGEDKHYISAAN